MSHRYRVWKDGQAREDARLVISVAHFARAAQDFAEWLDHNEGYYPDERTVWVLDERWPEHPRKFRVEATTVREYCAEELPAATSAQSQGRLGL